MESCTRDPIKLERIEEHDCLKNSTEINENDEDYYNCCEHQPNNCTCESFYELGYCKCRSPKFYLNVVFVLYDGSEKILSITNSHEQFYPHMFEIIKNDKKIFVSYV